MNRSHIPNHAADGSIAVTVRPVGCAGRTQEARDGPSDRHSRRAPERSPHHLGVPLLLHSVPAGFPSPAEDYMDKRLDLNEYLIRHPAATFFVRAAGDSMMGAGIHDGDLLLVDRAITPRSGQVVIAIIDGELMVKRLHIDSRPSHRGSAEVVDRCDADELDDASAADERSRERIRLLPENPGFPAKEIEPGEEFEVWGVVTHVIHPLE